MLLSLLIGVAYLSMLSVEAEVVCPQIKVRSSAPCSCEEYLKKPGTVQFQCGFLPSTGDESVSRLLDTFLTTPRVSPSISPLVHLVLRNNLTRVPRQIQFFPQLESINLNHNNIKAIESGAFNFKDTIARLVSVEVNGLETIAPGAFKGLILLQ